MTTPPPSAPDARPGGAGGEAARGPRRGWRRAGAGVAAVLVLAGLFVAGTRLPGILNPLGAAPAPVATSPSATPTPTPTPVPTSTAGPQLAGTFEWNQLRGGECISPYVSAWQQRFTVVDCAVPHAAQVMSTGTLGADTTVAYPGQSAIAEDLNLLCQRPENFDSSILGAYPDVIWQASYPVTDAQWQAGQRSYYCFVSRSGTEPMVGSFAPPAFTG